MSEDAVFFRQAAEAIVATSLNVGNVDPTIRELLSRIKYVNPEPKENGTNKNARTNTDSDVLLMDGFKTGGHKGSSSDSNGGEPTLVFNRKERQNEEKGVGNGEELQETKESNGPDRQFHCAKCKLVFRRSSDLRRHERTHLPVLPNICSQCGKGFARKDALKRHFDTLTCRRNRSKLLSIGGDINEILERAQQTGTGL